MAHSSGVAAAASAWMWPPGGVLSTKVYPVDVPLPNGSPKVSLLGYNDDPLFSAKSGINMGRIFENFLGKLAS